MAITSKRSIFQDKNICEISMGPYKVEIPKNVWSEYPCDFISNDSTVNIPPMQYVNVDEEKWGLFGLHTK